MKIVASEALAMQINHALLAESAKLYVSNKKSPDAPSCKIEGCPNEIWANWMCNAHNIRARLGKPMDAPLRHSSSHANCQQCGAKADNKGGWGLCKKHYAKRRRDIIKRICIAFLGDKCMTCQQEFPPAVFDFHHRDASTKEDSPSTMFSNRSVRAVADEVVKCDLLCANCHRIHHNAEEL